MSPFIPDMEAEKAQTVSFKLPFPPSSLSGHAKGNWRAKHAETQRHRREAQVITLAALKGVRPRFEPGDIPIRFRFVAPDRRSDRTNLPGRLKPMIDGIADALGINDVRFHPRYEFAEPEAPGRVEVTIG